MFTPADDEEIYRKNGMNSFLFEELMKDVRSETRSYNGAKSELWTLINFLKSTRLCQYQIVDGF